MAGKIVIQQVRSKIGRPKAQHEALKGLGLRRIGHSVEREDTPSVRGQVAVVAHLVKVESGDKA